MFPELTKHPDYLRGQTLEWCNQLAAKTGKYEYTWNNTYEGQTAENILTEKLSSLLHGKVLEVGCGHGEYAVQWANVAVEIVGYDMTEGFIATANRNRKSNVRYVLGRTHDGLPFPDDYFDIAYTKKGPTSWYEEGNRVVRPGGTILLFHPGDGNGEGAELGTCFPGLFGPPSVGTPILDKIQERLETSDLTNIEMSVLKETVWIPTPEDVFEMVCFGQSGGFRKFVRDECYNRIVSQFEKHSSEKGIKTTGFYYLIQANAS
ncbi:class I SAM-dependent methyltransferase [Paenibacillus harenae]|uniref:class I SAM-dependent methyltransferase n=1 Tax=Paenibacillus harenae TaxID=306543 RepID=UPI0027920FBE|nr:class I SAM-dependent methyltransferase [Paenibacillus harenae]MDQ0060741.1 23S rRNA (guanine745-N1)-methyltransferase [Paenibacillus harenae]